MKLIENKKKRKYLSLLVPICNIEKVKYNLEIINKKYISDNEDATTD